MSCNKMPSVQLSRIFSYISFRNMRFLILDCPSDENLPIYLEEFVAHNVTDVVRVCEPSYHTELLAQHNINVHDWHFQDGTVPPCEVIHNWLDLVEERFGSIHYNKKIDMNATVEFNDKYIAGEHNDPTIAIHCVAGLGRAPALVAIALIESGMESLDAVTYIRRYRRGAFNSKQIAFLDSYKRGQYNKKSSVLASIMLKKNRNSTGSNGKQNTNLLSVKSNTSSSTFNIRKRSPSSKSMNSVTKNTSSSCSNITKSSSAQPIANGGSPHNSTGSNNRTSILFNFNKIFKSKSSSSTNSSKTSDDNMVMTDTTDNSKTKKKKYNLYV